MTEKEFIEECCIALEVDSGSLNRESSPENVEAWDSLGYLNLISMIDSELGFVIESDDLQKFETLGSIIDYLKSENILENS